MFVQSSFVSDEKKGVLYLVSTPIGNLQDMTMRAIDTLRTVDIIAAEDTRRTRKLLNHFGIDSRLVSYHEHNKHTSGSGIVQWLQEGKQIALVSDAGMPAISDPGYELVRDTTALQIPVIPIPGPNAGLSALIASGLPSERFMFVGFLPREKKRLVQELMDIQFYTGTIIFYESPHRIKKTLRECKEVLGDRSICIARELTKKYEEFIRGSLSEVYGYIDGLDQIRGEFTVILEGNSQEQVDGQSVQQEVLAMDPMEHVKQFMEEGLSSKEAIKKVAKKRGVAKQEIYRQYHTMKEK